MPDTRHHRGPHPDDHQLFGERCVAALRAAVSELSWLLSHDYAMDSALKLVGDRHDLTVRQRLAVRRCACADAARNHRAGTLLPAGEIAGLDLGIDGYNLLITVESALSGGAIFRARDGCFRDLASVHSTYRKVSETGPALDLIFQSLALLQPRRVDWLLDRPVSNSGRLKAFMMERVKQQATEIASLPVHVEIVDSPDAVLLTYQGVVATSDSNILDRCSRWTNLASQIIESHIPRAWKVDLRCLEEPFET